MSALIDAIEAPEPLIEDVALAIASDEYPGLSRPRYHGLLDGWAEAIRPTMEAQRDPRQKLRLLLSHLYGTLAFNGNSDDYYDPRNSYFNDVLERRTGIPITLAAVLMAMGRRLGVRIEGVGFPGHFLARAFGPGGVFIDPFNGGNILERPDLMALARRFMPGDEAFVLAQLEPVSERAMAIRMLFNLQQIYEKRGDHARALVVCDRLVDIADAPFHRRDRGIHALALGAYESAREDLHAYLAHGPQDDERARVQELLDKMPSSNPRVN